MPAFFSGGVQDNVDRGLLGRLDGALLLDYDAKDEICIIEWCRLSSLAIGATMRATMVARAAALMARLLLLDYDAVKRMRNRERS